MDTMKIYYSNKSSLYKENRILQNIPLFKTKAIINNNEEQFFLLLDTGSNASILHKNAIIEFSKIEINTTERFFNISILSFDDFELKKSIKFYIDSNAKLTTSEDFPNHIGLIGMDFLKSYCLTINYKEKYFQLDNPSKLKVENSIFYVFENKFLFLFISIKNKKFKLLFDTGMNGDYILFEKSLQSFNFNDFKIKEEHIGNGHQGNVYNIIHYEEDIELKYNKYSHFSCFKIIKNHPFFEQYNFDGIIGNDFFSSNIIQVDYINEHFNIKIT